MKKLIKSLPGMRNIVAQRDQLLLETARLTEKIRPLEDEKQARMLSKRHPYPFTNSGYCFCCNSMVDFTAQGEWWRDQYVCQNCGSIPRERALMASIERHYPNWRSLDIHESSPIERGATIRLKRECPGYQASQCFPGIAPGSIYQGYRCENLEALTLADSSVDLFITQDVFEHIFHPGKAFKEIARVLKPGGAHVFTTPLINKNNPSAFTALLKADNSIEHLIDPPEYHGNPISAEGSLVTVHWGYDICDWIYRSSGLISHIEFMDNLDLGIRAEYIEVIVSRKQLV